MNRQTVRPAESARAIPVGPRVRWTVVVLAALAIGIYFPLQYVRADLATLAGENVGLAPTYADRPSFVQVAFYLHIGFAGLALLIGGFQFSRRLRRRAPRAHRWVGRIYVGAVLLGGAAGFVMSFFSSVALLGFFGFGSLALLWMWVTYRGYAAIRAGGVPDHQAWMIRSFALTYAGVTLRVWLLATVIVMVALHSSGDLETIAYAPLPFLSWLPNIVVAEWMVYRRELPGLRFTSRLVTSGRLDPPIGGEGPT